ncbi:MAG: AAA family ATPase [Actinomycetota bacterium]|nr:AAA family ATPase [Actinomycetota bacterium]
MTADVERLTETLDRERSPDREGPFGSILARFRMSYPQFRIGDEVIRRYHLSMSTRGFVIVCGPSGTGKTWLAQAYAYSAGANTKLVAVDPSWTSNEDLLGYLSPLDGFYHHTPFSEFVREAAHEWDQATRASRAVREFHVILDEMNLARVEHYFSRFLSAMEVRARDGSAPLDLAPGHRVQLTPNLKFAGTVNMDETTHGFADKVFDRAQLIELPLLRSDVVAQLASTPYGEKLLAVWDALEPIGPFGFRVLDEIHTYVTAADDEGTPWQVALDEELVQKVLPRIRGADARVAAVLDGLTAATADGCPLAQAKVLDMRREFDTYGFTSFF